MMKRIAFALGAAALILTGCGSDGGGDPQPGSKSLLPATTFSKASATVTATAPKVGAVDTPFEIPCGYSDDQTCMTITFSNVRTVDSCGLLDQYETFDRIVALDIRAEMPANADPEFRSPFRSFPWSARTASGQVTSTDKELCDDSVLDLMRETPGGFSLGTVYLDVPTDTDTIIFEPNYGPKGVFQIPTPSPTATTPDAAPTVEAEAPVEEPAAAQPPVGYTGAPTGPPTSLPGKTIAFCMSDTALYQPGTTQFTDGTTGYTEECAAQSGG